MTKISVEQMNAFNNAMNAFDEATKTINTAYANRAAGATSPSAVLTIVKAINTASTWIKENGDILKKRAESASDQNLLLYIIEQATLLKSVKLDPASDGVDIKISDRSKSDFVAAVNSLATNMRALHQNIATHNLSTTSAVTNTLTHATTNSPAAAGATPKSRGPVPTASRPLPLPEAQQTKAYGNMPRMENRPKPTGATNVPLTRPAPQPLTEEAAAHYGLNTTPQEAQKSTSTEANPTSTTVAAPTPAANSQATSQLHKGVYGSIHSGSELPVKDKDAPPKTPNFRGFKK